MNMSTLYRTENTQRYFNDIAQKKYAPIADSILRKMFQNRERYREQIINAHIRLVATIAKTYDNNEKFMDFNQEGIEGLMEAFEKYDPTSPAKFSTYASFWIKSKMSMLCKDLEMVQKSNVLKIGSKAIKFQEDFYKREMREATPDEVLEYLSDCGVDIQNEDEILNVSMKSINDDLSDDGDFTLEDSGEFATLTASDNDYNKVIEQEAMAEHINRMMANLTEREQEFIKRHIYNGESYEVIAGLEGFTIERVRQIVVGGLKKMKSSEYAKKFLSQYL